MKIKYSIILLVSILIAGCAKQGMPSGGSKDVTPPQSLRMSPSSGTLNNSSNEFFIEFDEYVVIKDAENNILVTPPMKENPEVKTKGKGVKVTIKDTLQPNTTYLFQFKEAIADFNEGNLLPSLEYVFSTGDYIDSMTVGGDLVEALSMKALEEVVSVWLMSEEKYQQAVKAMSDTLVAKPQPDYITRTNKKGHFSFNNIKPGDYRIIALKDEDKNREIGSAEAVAFLDSTMVATVMKKAEKDTVKAEKDSVVHVKTTTPILRLFTPKNERQRLTDSKFILDGKVLVTSQLPMTAPVLESGEEKITWRINSQRDTLTLWTLRKDCDSLQLVISDITGINDTLRLKWHSKKKSQKGPSNAALKPNNMRVSTNALPYYDTLSLVFAVPLDTSRCKRDSVARIMLLKDSSVSYCDALLDTDAMKVLLLYQFRQGEKYDIDIAKGLFTDIYGTANDSLHTTITVSKAEDYGNLTMNIETTGGEKLIVELLDEKDKVQRTHSLLGNGMVKFANLKPAKYRIRVIVDSNRNGLWDSGDFASQRQPERVIYFDKTLDIRANWDFEEKLKIEN
ncbi:MAG: Ig-like domain-containing protein [Bacteroidales bacterium]|nr:Ig-like domain-containing protein [Bacteroidales bacterium]